MEKPEMKEAAPLIGLDPAAIVPITAVPVVADAAARFTAGAADWIEDRFGLEYFEWKLHGHHASHDVLSRVFARDELIRIWHDCIFASKLDDHLQEHAELIWKVRHSIWRYGAGDDYARFVACHNGLARLAIDLPGFAVRVTHTRSINTAAWAAHGREDPIYLDASFGVLVYYQGRHVMTIGFALAARGILVAQVQLRQKRGNRFLYKLPTGYLDFALDLLQRAFPADTLYLVTGSSTTAAIRSAYGKNADKLAPETADRIERFYDQPISNYERTGETVRCGSDDGRVFARLARAEIARREAA